MTPDKILKQWDEKFGCGHKIYLSHCRFCEMRGFLQRSLYEKGQRTPSQSNSIYLFLTWLSDALNAAGKDMRVVLKPSYLIPWNKDNAHDHIWIPIQKAMYGTEHTRELKKIGQIENVHEVIMREMGKNHGIEWIDFPNDPDPAPLLVNK